MGTNYYFIDEHEKQWHVGKSSNGWKFIFQAQPQLNIFTGEGWYQFLVDEKIRRIDATILVDEYDKDITDLERWYDFNVDQRERLAIMNRNRAELGFKPFDYLYDSYTYNQTVYDTWSPDNKYVDKDGNVMYLGEFS